MDAATVLANHALALLAAGTVLFLLATAAVIGLVHLMMRNADRLRPHWSRVRPWMPARHVAIHLMLGCIAIIAVVAVVMIAREVGPGSRIARFDQAFAHALDESATPRWRRFFQVVTLAGTGMALGIASTIVGLLLMLRRQLALAIGWAVAQGGAVLLVKAIKATVERTRPGLGDPTFFAHGWSFPSGHVVRTFAFCGMGAYVIYRLTGSWRATAVACGIGGVCSFVMAFSRLYLGAHFPSDVVAGLIVGTAWIAVCVSAMEEALGRRYRSES